MVEISEPTRSLRVTEWSQCLHGRPCRYQLQLSMSHECQKPNGIRSIKRIGLFTERLWVRVLPEEPTKIALSILHFAGRPQFNTRTREPL
jgi:hypothetical protein